MSGQGTGPGQKMTRVDKSILEVLLFLHNTLRVEWDRKLQKRQIRTISEVLLNSDKTEHYEQTGKENEKSGKF